ncbi:MAG: DPP IV N-terminal domain-containing protein, partial [Hoylesella buccalis]
MKKIILGIIALFMATSNIHSTERITLKAIQDGAFAAERLSGIKPIAGTDQYARISKDGNRVVRYSFKTGKQTAVLFDVNHTMGSKIDSFDGYILSPDGAKMLIQTKTERIYRRSFKAQYYIYTIASTKLEPLSEGGPQQVPVWSADSRQIAFVRDNNIHLIKLLYDNAESQVTKDGKFNEIINGVPDWVNEEEFGHNLSFCFNADGTKICWIKYDESNVKSYALQLFKGMHPEQHQYADYPGLYTYK